MQEAMSWSGVCVDLPDSAVALGVALLLLPLNLNLCVLLRLLVLAGLCVAVRLMVLAGLCLALGMEEITRWEGVG